MANTNNDATHVAVATQNTQNDVNNKQDYIASATWLIKVIAIMLAIAVLARSKNAFFFFLFAMLPSITAFLLDKGHHKCASATVCTFNLIGVLPSLHKLFASTSASLYFGTNAFGGKVSSIIYDYQTWFVVYGITTLGSILYLIIPLLFGKMYVTHANKKIEVLQSKKKDIVDEWKINLEDMK